MVEMYEVCEGMFVPKECCTFTKGLESGESMADDERLPCGGVCDKVCEDCVIQEVFNGYARLSGRGSKRRAMHNRGREDGGA